MDPSQAYARPNSHLASTGYRSASLPAPRASAPAPQPPSIGPYGAPSAYAASNASLAHTSYRPGQAPTAAAAMSARVTAAAGSSFVPPAAHSRVVLASPNPQPQRYATAPATYGVSLSHAAPYNPNATVYVGASPAHVDVVHVGAQPRLRHAPAHVVVVNAHQDEQQDVNAHQHEQQDVHVRRVTRGNASGCSVFCKVLGTLALIAAAFFAVAAIVAYSPGFLAAALFSGLVGTVICLRA